MKPLIIAKGTTSQNIAAKTILQGGGILHSDGGVLQTT
jgi:hypothetical protein